MLQWYSPVSAPGFHQNFMTFQGPTDVGSLLLLGKQWVSIKLILTSPWFQRSRYKEKIQHKIEQVDKWESKPAAPASPTYPSYYTSLKTGFFRFLMIHANKMQQLLKVTFTRHHFISCVVQYSACKTTACATGSLSSAGTYARAMWDRREKVAWPSVHAVQIEIKTSFAQLLTYTLDIYRLSLVPFLFFFLSFLFFLARVSCSSPFNF